MIKYKTLFDCGLTDFRKLLICLPVIIMSAVPVLGEPKALAAAILIQGVSNIDGYWDFLKDTDIYRPLRNMLYLLVSLSAAAAVLGLLSLVIGHSYFDTSGITGCIVTALTLLAVSFPAVLLVTDWKLNDSNEEYGKSLKNRQTGSEEDEL